MFAADLAPGEMHTFPPNLTYRLGAMSVDAAFLVVRSGVPWDLQEGSVAHVDRGALSARRPRDRARRFSTIRWMRTSVPYTAGYTRVDVLARTDRLRCLILGLGEKRCVPWHSHSEIDDTFFCIEGPMRVETRDPDATYVLMPGDTCRAIARQPHFVSGTLRQPVPFSWLCRAPVNTITCRLKPPSWDSRFNRAPFHKASGVAPHASGAVLTQRDSSINSGARR